MHESGFFNVVDGVIHNLAMGKCYSNLAVVIDAGTGRVMKYGELQDMKEYYDAAVDTAKGLAVGNLDQEISLLRISEMGNVFGVDNACTFVNLLCAGVDISEYEKLAVADTDDMKAMLQALQEERSL